MSDIDVRLEALAERVSKFGASIETEEATKTTLIMPFISQVLGYDVFNPHEVVPEYTTDVGTKKGEKVDYAIIRDNQPQILIEAKALKAPLDINHASQLFRYFAASHARVGVLTNGREYLFFTDLDKPNVMDSKPFMVLDLLDLDPSTLPTLARLAKDSFDVDSVVSAAEELKYVGALKRTLATQFSDPDEEWVRVLARRVFQGTYTAKAKEQFTPLVMKAMKQFLADQVNERLNAALMQRPAIPESAPQESELDENSHDDDNGIITTPEEIEAWQIIRAITCEVVAPIRVTHRDTKSYMGILLDDNNREPIARLHFNYSTKKLGLFNSDRVEQRHAIESLEDIYRFKDEIIATCKLYLD